MARKSVLIGLALVLLAAGAAAWREFAPVEVLTGQVTHVRDGDTIVVRGRPIRLDALNCDELGTSLGERAKTEMKRLVRGRELVCHLDGGKTYDRETGRCYLDGADIARAMIASGLCGRCDRYDPLFTYAITQWRAGPYQAQSARSCDFGQLEERCGNIACGIDLRSACS